MLLRKNGGQVQVGPVNEVVEPKPKGLAAADAPGRERKV